MKKRHPWDDLRLELARAQLDRQDSRMDSMQQRASHIITVAVSVMTISALILKDVAWSLPEKDDEIPYLLIARALMLVLMMTSFLLVMRNSMAILKPVALTKAPHMAAFIQHQKDNPRANMNVWSAEKMSEVYDRNECIIVEKSKKLAWSMRFLFALGISAAIFAIITRF